MIFNQSKLKKTQYPCFLCPKSNGSQTDRNNKGNKKISVNIQTNTIPNNEDVKPTLDTTKTSEFHHSFISTYNTKIFKRYPCIKLENCMKKTRYITNRAEGDVSGPKILEEQRDPYRLDQI